MSRLLKKQKTTNLSNKEQYSFRIASNIGYYNNLKKTKGMSSNLRIAKIER